MSKKPVDIAAKYFSKTGGYGGDIDLMLLAKLDALYIKLCNTEVSLEDELQRNVTLKGIEAERDMYYAQIGKHIVDEWRTRTAAPDAATGEGGRA
jgi:hypothetical protein